MGFAEFMERALYHPTNGFYETNRAGRRSGHFITSPEVGPLFGAVVARMLDRRWTELGRPDPFTVVDAGAGPGTLARSVAAARPDCSEALRWVNVERSASQRALHTVGESLATMPDDPFVGVIIANELLDNLPLRLFDTAGREVGASRPDDSEHLRPCQQEACRWLADAVARLTAGTVLVVDYMSTTHSMSGRPWREWLRTYRAHQRGDDPWTAPGTQDITCEVALDQLAEAVRPPDRCTPQAEWLAEHGIDELVVEGRAIWQEGAERGDLVALAARSRVREAEALCNSAGLGAFTVVEWDV